MASRQYFDYTGVDKRGKPVKGTAVVTGGKELDDSEVVLHLQRTLFPHWPKTGRQVKTATRIDSSVEQQSREINAPAKVKNIFHIMEEAEVAAQKRADEVARRQAELSNNISPETEVTEESKP